MISSSWPVGAELSGLICVFLSSEGCISDQQAGRILRHHYVTGADFLTALICTNPLTKEG
ncbi:hypothetical protein EB105725_11_01725 [Shimwellia blattae DSM 4481 = NBRC 105725]|nr:hypothetical protein EB105725_11_01725 [Shimwellia blattae DSM 4481 = NBRC 105725]